MTRRDFFRSAAGGAAAASASAWAQQAAEKAKLLNLRITGLKTIVVHTGSSNWVFCKIRTNEGLTGVGEGSITSKESTLAAAITEHERFLIGKDPTDIELLWQGMFRHPRWRGGPILNSAISAVEIALWDILGKALGVAVYKLLGGAARKRVRLYLDVGSTPEAFLRAKELGYTAAKSEFVAVQDGVVVPAYTVREGLRRLEAVRKAVGDDFDICIDVHGKLTTVMAVDFCTRAEPYRPFFIEEATQLEDFGELAHLRSKTKVPLATGERSFTKYAFTDYCSRHLVDYVQPDVCHAGGILEMKRIGTIAEAYRVEMAPHNPQSELSSLASVHVDACTPSSTIQEYNPRSEQWIKDLFYGAGVKAANGFAELPQLPGLGIDIDEGVAAKHPYQPVNRQHLTFRDGSVADL